MSGLLNKLERELEKRAVERMGPLLQEMKRLEAELKRLNRNLEKTNKLLRQLIEMRGGGK